MRRQLFGLKRSNRFHISKRRAAMSIPASSLLISEARRWISRNHKQASRQLRRHALGRHCVRAALAVAAFAIFLALPARTQAQEFVPCPPEQQTLLTVPELASQNGVLRGTVMLSDEKEAIPFRVPPQSRPGDPGTEVKCQPQYV